MTLMPLFWLFGHAHLFQSKLWGWPQAPGSFLWDCERQCKSGICGNQCKFYDILPPEKLCMLFWARSARFTAFVQFMHERSITWCTNALAVQSKFPVNSCLTILWVLSCTLLLWAWTLGGHFSTEKLQKWVTVTATALGDVPAVATVVLGSWSFWVATSDFGDQDLQKWWTPNDTAPKLSQLNTCYCSSVSADGLVGCPVDQRVTCRYRTGENMLEVRCEVSSMALSTGIREWSFWWTHVQAVLTLTLTVLSPEERGF